MQCHVCIFLPISINIINALSPWQNGKPFASQSSYKKIEHTIHFQKHIILFRNNRKALSFKFSQVSDLYEQYIQNEVLMKLLWLLWKKSLPLGILKRRYCPTIALPGKPASWLDKWELANDRKKLLQQKTVTFLPFNI